ncbi:UNVERIFIED_CONTAM: hypothetical protein NCL1_48397 [Trichonephila clavipes]
MQNDGGHNIISKTITGDETYISFFDFPTGQESNNLHGRRFNSEEETDVAINAFFHQFQEMNGLRHLICRKNTSTFKT